MLPSRVGFEDPEFPCEAETDEECPRKVVLRGTSSIDPEVWDAEVEGLGGGQWIEKGSGYLCGMRDAAGQKLYLKPFRTHVSKPDT